MRFRSLRNPMRAGFADNTTLHSMPRWSPLSLAHSLRGDRVSRIHDVLGGAQRADDLGIRPERRGAGWQRLRATCGLIAEWLRICHREGWLGSARTNRRSKTTRAEDWQTAGEEAADSLADVRDVIGLAAPYGKTAHALNDRFSADPPSRVYAAERKAVEDAKAAEKKGKRKPADKNDQAHAAAADQAQASKPPPDTPAQNDVDESPF